MGPSVLGAVDHVGDDGAGRGKLSRAASIVHGITQGVAADKDGVKHIVHAVKRIFLPDQERGHHGVIFPIHLSDAGKQLDELVHFMRVKEVLAGDFRDSFRVDLFVTGGFSCHEGGENGNLAAGVIALHIRFGIAFRVALLLCFLQAGLKVTAFFRHAG